MINISYLKFEKMTQQSFEKLMTTIPSSFHKKITAYRYWEDQYASLFGKILLKNLLVANGYEDTILSYLKYNEYGKPFIDEPVCFSISHSGNMVVCALVNNSEIGIDIELLKKIDILPFKNVFTENEWETITESVDSLKTFYTLWTKKESVIKADGRGLSIPLHNVSIETKIAVIHEYHQKKLWHLNEVPIDHNYSSYLSINPNCFIKSIKEFDLQSYLNYVDIEAV